MCNVIETNYEAYVTCFEQVCKRSELQTPLALVKYGELII